MIFTFDINKGKWKGKKASLVQNGDGYVHIRVHGRNVRPDGRGWKDRVIHYQGGRGYRGYQMGKHFSKKKHIVLKLREVGVEFPDVDYEALEKKFKKSEPKEFKLEGRYPLRFCTKPQDAHKIDLELFRTCEFGYHVRHGFPHYVIIGMVIGKRGSWWAVMGEQGSLRTGKDQIEAQVHTEDIIDHVFATKDEATKHVVIRHKMENRD